MGQHLVMIDGMSFVFRAYHAVRQGLTRADGLPTNALFGFAQMLVKVVDDLVPDACVVVLDSPPPNWRHALYGDYKANRPPPDEALVRQLAFLEPMVAAFGLPVLRMDGMEADDILATLCTRVPEGVERITIVSSDKDLLQLVGERGGVVVRMLDTLKDKWSGPEECVEKFGVAPELAVDVQALMGDSSDNVPGVKGIGPKTASGLVAEFGGIESLYARLGEVKNERIKGLLLEYKEMAFLSKQLVSLKRDIDLPGVDLTFHPRLHEAAGYLRDVLEFRALAGRLEKRGGAKPAVAGVEKVLAGGEEELAGRPHGPAGWGEYECVTTEEVWRRWVKDVRAQGVVAFDTETTSLDPLTCEVVGLSLALAPGKACYVPLRHKEVGAGAEVGGLFSAPGEGLVAGQLDVRVVLADVKALLEDPAVKVVAHNLKFDGLVVACALKMPLDAGSLSALLRGNEDTLLLSACLDGGRWGHGLDDLVNRHLGHSMIAFEDVCGRGKKQVTFDYVPLDAATAYAAEDADATWRLWELFAERMRVDGGKEGFGPRCVYETAEKPLLPVVMAMEALGVCVDAPYLRHLSDDLGGRMAELEARIHTVAGRAFNVQSTQQLAVILFDEWGVGTDRMKKSRSTGVDVLEALQEAGEPGDKGVQLAEAILGYRSLAKLRSTYTEALLKQIHPITHRVHTHYHQMGAATGRFSSSDPNLQNIPVRTEEGRKIRRAFVPRAGWRMLSADYSQIELRLLAHFSGSEGLRRAFADGLDIHAYTASLIHDIPLSEVTKDLRRASKFINFGLVYGMGARALAKQIGVRTDEAAAWMAAYFRRYEGVKEYMDLNRALAKERGFVETLLGRRVWLPDIASPNGALRSNAERAAINAPLQGSNADIIKLAMPKVLEALAPYRAALLMQVHDELVLEVHPDDVDAVQALLPRVMGDVVALRVPLVVEVGVGADWEEAH